MHYICTYIYVCKICTYICADRFAWLLCPNQCAKLRNPWGQIAPWGDLCYPVSQSRLYLHLKKKVHNMQSIFYKYFGSLIFCKHLSSLYFYFDTLKSFLYIFLIIITMLGIFILIFYLYSCNLF